MRIPELMFITVVLLWLLIPLAYALLVTFDLDVKLTARNKGSSGGIRTP